MQPQTQDSYPDITPEEAKAMLGFSTKISEDLMASMAPQQTEGAPTEAPQTQEMTPQSVEEPESDKSLEGKMDEKMEILRTELKDTIKLEIEGIRKDIKEALDEQED